MLRFVLPMLMIATPAAAQDFYGAMRVGQSFSEDGEGASFEDGAYGLALGADFGALRLEAGAQQASGALTMSNKLREGSVDAIDYSLTVFGDLPVGERATLFVGAGIDYLDGESETCFWSCLITQTVDVNKLGAHIVAGGAYQFTSNLTGEIQYRRLDVNNLQFMSRRDAEFTLETVTLGLRVGF